MRTVQVVAAPSSIGLPAASPEALDLADQPLVPAAVLVAFLMGTEPGILLTKRTAHLTKHAGQVSFPGGRIDAVDESPEAAALREAHEEIALERENVELTGRLGDYVTGTGYLAGRDGARRARAAAVRARGRGGLRPAAVGVARPGGTRAAPRLLS
jgi:8-oxo-dGTP pyrophosphatase MutT (NUDIX family)